MATIAKQTRSFASPTVSLTAAAGGGDQFLASEKKAVLLVVNEDVSSVDVTLANTVSSPPAGLTGADAVITVPAAAGGVAGMVEIPAPAGSWDNFKDVNGYVQVTYAGVTALWVALVERGS